MMVIFIALLDNRLDGGLKIINGLLEPLHLVNIIFMVILIDLFDFFFWLAL